MPIPKFTPSHPSAPWRVYHRGRSFWFKEEKAATDKCTDLARGITGKLTAREVDEYLHAKEILKGTPVLHAARFFIERNPTVNRSTTVADAIKSHLEANKGKRPDYYERMEYLLGKLDAEAGAMFFSAVTPTVIEKLLQAESSVWVRNDLLTHMRVLFRAATRKRLIPEDPTAPFDHETATPSKVILTLEDTRRILEVARDEFPDILPAVALQLFAGIRTKEITRLDWSLVKHGEFIDVSALVAKTHERRVIDWWPPSLTEWMPTAEASGPIIPKPKTYEHKKWMLIAVCRKAFPGFRFGQNAFRHSFCSYACAYFENAGKTALLAGQHDVHIFFKNYRLYRTKLDAEKYFGFLK